MAHAGGRPSKYEEKYAQELLDYFSEDVVKEIKTVTQGSNGKGGEWSKEEVRYEALFFPTLELFAHKIGVDDDTLQNWADARFPEDHEQAGERQHPEFFGAYTRAKKIQKGLLLQYALIGKLNPGFAQFFAVNNLGMQSKSVVENNGEVVHKFGDMTDEELDRVIKARQDRLS